MHDLVKYKIKYYSNNKNVPRAKTQHGGGFVKFLFDSINSIVTTDDTTKFNIGDTVKKQGVDRYYTIVQNNPLKKYKLFSTQDNNTLTDFDPEDFDIIWRSGIKNNLNNIMSSSSEYFMFKLVTNIWKYNDKIILPLKTDFQSFKYNSGTNETYMLPCIKEYAEFDLTEGKWNKQTIQLSVIDPKLTIITDNEYKKMLNGLRKQKIFLRGDIVKNNLTNEIYIVKDYGHLKNIVNFMKSGDTVKLGPVFANRNSEINLYHVSLSEKKLVSVTGIPKDLVLMRPNNKYIRFNTTMVNNDMKKIIKFCNSNKSDKLFFDFTKYGIQLKESNTKIYNFITQTDSNVYVKTNIHSDGELFDTYDIKDINSGKIDTYSGISLVPL